MVETRVKNPNANVLRVLDACCYNVLDQFLFHLTAF